MAKSIIKSVVKSSIKSDTRSSTEPVRLNKYIASSGISSRRKADELISEGKVQVNGKKVYELGLKVSPHQDKILVEGELVKPMPDKYYVMFCKPKRVLTTMEDPEGRPCVGDYIRDLGISLYPVGRLDWESEGLLLLTNDGEFAQKVTHPKHEIKKTYLAKLNDKPSKEKLDKLLRGVSIPGGRVKAVEIETIKKSAEKDWVRIVITEGKNHQVREMFKKIDCDVLKLRRVQIGLLALNNLGPGEHTFLTPDAIAKIFKAEPGKKERKTSVKKIKTTESSGKISQSKRDQRRHERSERRNEFRQKRTRR